ncbi:MAG TPA: helix-turn-helix transcriptional regulator [Chryseolinea sp.]|nr:helix-turn-helix transcriptional regulator [Chryseolinea sp.]
MTHQLNIFLLLFGALQGGLLSLLLFRNRRRHLANTYFAFFITVVGLQLIFKVITKSWLMGHASFAYNVSYSFPYLIGPLLYLYIKARKENIFSKKDLLHFIPFGISMMGVALSMLFWFNVLQFHSYVDAALQITSLCAYGFAAYRLGNTELRPFIIMVAVSEAIIAVTLAVMHVYYPDFPDIRMLFLVLTALIYWISYQAMSKPDLFIEGETLPVVSIGFSKNPKYAHSSLKDTEAKRIEEALHSIMNRDKLYLESDLTIDTLANKLGTSRHHLSQVLNERIKKTYGDFITDLRLEESCRRLSNRANYRFTIAAVALDSGFSSVSSFNDVFKKRYGMTPSKFRDEHLNKMSA